MTRARHHAVEGGPAAKSALPTLGRQFMRQRARAQRAWRSYAATSDKIDADASAKAHQKWSDAVDSALLTIQAISVEPAHDLSELLLQYEAIYWWLGEDDNILDGSTRRWLGRFRRSLRGLARKG